MGIQKDLNLDITWKYQAGPLNLISDVDGIRVGHSTVKDPDRGIYTGVTALLPQEGPLYRRKLLASSSVINGYGKSLGLIQVEELGTIETPLLFTGTFSVGIGYTAMIKYMLDQDDIIGRPHSVNPIVFECNDGKINDNRKISLTEQDFFKAIDNAEVDFAEGDVGAGTGMICMGLKGGIGSASRKISVYGSDFTIGALVLSNFGVRGDLRIAGRKVDKAIQQTEEARKDMGSIIAVLATDLPMSSRQLKRLSKRIVVPISRLGSYIGDGSGDIGLAFSTTNGLERTKSFQDIRVVHDLDLDPVFEAAAEACEEAILSSLSHSQVARDIWGNEVPCLRDILNK